MTLPAGLEAMVEACAEAQYEHQRATNPTFEMIPWAVQIERIKNLWRASARAAVAVSAPMVGQYALKIVQKRIDFLVNGANAHRRDGRFAEAEEWESWVAETKTVREDLRCAFPPAETPAAANQETK